MKAKQRGTALVIVLGVILVVTLLSVVVISFMLSQSRLTKHQVDRMKAKFLAQSGINYALEMIRLGTWVVPTSGTNNYSICNASPPCSKADADFPYRVDITISPVATASGALNGTAPINATVNYTYSQP